jgi:hypothetical protein
MGTQGAEQPKTAVSGPGSPDPALGPADPAIHHRQPRPEARYEPADGRYTRVVCHSAPPSSGTIGILHTKKNARGVMTARSSYRSRRLTAARRSAPRSEGRPAQTLPVKPSTRESLSTALEEGPNRTTLSGRRREPELEPPRAAAAARRAAVDHARGSEQGSSFPVM